MNSLWKITVDDYLEVVRRAKDAGLKPGESMEKIFVEYMKEKNQKPIGATELTQDELMKEHASKGQNVLSIQIDKNGKSQYKISKNKKLDT